MVRRPLAVTAELAVLTEALDDPMVDIADLLTGLDTAVRSAVASSVGLTLTVSIGGDPIVLTTRPAGIDGGVSHLETIVASLAVRLSLPADAPGGPGATASVTLYAVTAGAFVDLAADIVWLTGSPGADVVMDTDLAAPAAVPTSWLRDQSTINQAVGVLIARGRMPDAALAELDAWAAAHGVTRLAAAEDVLGRSPGGW